MVLFVCANGDGTFPNVHAGNAATFQTLYEMRNLSNPEKFWSVVKTCLSNNISQ